MAQTFGCRRCYSEDPRHVWAYYEQGLAVERELVFEPHFIVQLRHCAECGQQFLWIFSEAIDWESGGDAQRREIVPVSATEAETAGKLDYPSLAALGLDRRYLETDWPTDAADSSAVWSTGQLRLPASRIR
jgi:hypothetical protein